MGRRIWVKVEADEYDLDPVLSAMTAEEVGAYELLRRKALAQGSHGSLTNDDTLLARWARLPAARWTAVKPAVLNACLPSQDDRLVFSGLRRAAAEAKFISEKRAEAGRKGGLKKASNSSKPSKILANRKQNSSKPSFLSSSLSSPDSSKSHPTSRRAGGMNSPRPPSCSESERPTPELLFPAPESKDEPPPEKQSQPPRAVMTFPVVGKDPGDWQLTAAKVAEWREAFPGIDVIAECRKARQWCLDNPGRRKTRRGITAFLGRWLSKAQDELGRPPGFRPSSPEDDDGWSNPATSPDPNVGVPLTPERIRQIERDLVELEAGRGLK
jgi:uncharacterized protein YdaU (DUF1376 family)